VCLNTCSPLKAARSVSSTGSLHLWQFYRAKENRKEEWAIKKGCYRKNGVRKEKGSTQLLTVRYLVPPTVLYIDT